MSHTGNIQKGQSESVNRRSTNNGQKKRDKTINNNLQNITHKTKDRVTPTPLKSEGEFAFLHVF